MEASQLGRLFRAGVLWGQMTGYVVGRENELTWDTRLLWQSSRPSHLLCQVGYLQVLYAQSDEGGGIAPLEEEDCPVSSGS